MTAPVLHASPPRRAVLHEQVRVLRQVLRWPGIALVRAMALLAAVFAVELHLEQRSFDFHPEQLLIPALVGVLLPIGVWSREERFGRSFLWTLPVDRREHALVRALAGWAWLMAAIALYFFVLLALALWSGDRLLSAETVQLLASGAPYPEPGTLQPGAWTMRQWQPSPLLWLVPFTAATVTYLFASALALGTRYPMRWIVGTMLGTFLVFTIGEAANIGWLMALPDALVEPTFLGPYGVSTVLTARTEFLKVGTTLTTGETVTVWRSLPDLAQWALATLLWTGAGLAALWAAAHRHRERRRG